MFHVTSDVGGGTYSTNFLGTENPLSEGGRWLNGFTDGKNWQDCRCTPGQAFGTGLSASPPYNDPTAVLRGNWGITQTAEAKVIVPASPAGSEEVELHLLTTIDSVALSNQGLPGRITGYEVLFSVTTNNYVDIERWDGGTDLADFHSLVPGGFTLSPAPLSTGNWVKATVTAAGVFSAYIDYTGNRSNYQLIFQSNPDLTYRTGAPGIGFFGRTPGVMSDFGFSYFTCSAT